MSALRKSVVFLALTFAFSWGASFAFAALGLNTSPLPATGALLLMMMGPAFGALVCAQLFEKGRRRESLGLKWSPNWWWLVAWFGALALAVLSVAFTIAGSNNRIADISTHLIAMVEQASGAQAANQLRALHDVLPALLGVQVVIGSLINAPILTMTEELGWRGYLYHLWRPAGFWKSSFATGAVWGLWHAPAILLYGLNYPQNREIGVALFVLYCTMLGPLMTFIRDRGRSVIASGIAHGAINAFGGVTLLALTSPAFPWNGIVGVGGFIALAVLLAPVALAQRGLAPKPSVA